MGKLSYRMPGNFQMSYNIVIASEFAKEAKRIAKSTGNSQIAS